MASKGGKKKDDRGAPAVAKEGPKSAPLQKALAQHEAGDVARARGAVLAYLKVNPSAPDADAARAYLERTKTPMMALYFGITVAVVAMVMVFIASRQP